MEGTNKAHEIGEAMGFVGVRLTDQLGNTAVMRFMVTLRISLRPSA